jgi:conjugative relaxase-like TrwC/TraI family protein
MSHDEATGEWKSLHSPTLYQRRGYLTEVYRNSLAQKVVGFGYKIENQWNDKGTDLSFEIVGVPPPLCKKMSKRSTEKEEAIAEFIEKHGKEPTDNEVAVLVRATREDKLRKITAAEVRAHQRGQTHPGGNPSLDLDQGTRPAKSDAAGAHAGGGLP